MHTFTHHETDFTGYIFFSFNMQRKFKYLPWKEFWNISTLVHWPIYQLILVKHGYSFPILYSSTGTKARPSSHKGTIPNYISWQNVLREHLSARGSWLALWLLFQYIPPNLKSLPHLLPCGEFKQVFILYIIAKKKLNICWPRYFIKSNNSHKNNKTTLTINLYLLCFTYAQFFSCKVWLIENWLTGPKALLSKLCPWWSPSTQIWPCGTFTYFFLYPMVLNRIGKYG